MTPEALEEAILAGDVPRCLALLAGATEGERRAAAPAAVKWRQAAFELQIGQRAAAPVPGTDPARLREAIDVAVLGTATLSELKKLGARAGVSLKHGYAVLAARKPEWLPAWADWVLSEWKVCWGTVRRLVRDGYCPRPQTDDYILGLVGAAWFEHHRPLRELLLGDPELLEYEVWRLFEVEGGGEDSLAARDKYARPGHSWSQTLVALADENILPRQRLLDASLDALTRDLPQFQAGWFSRFHEALSPDLDERAARIERYLELLSSPVPPTVSFALKAVTLLEKVGRAPVDLLISRVGPALGAREKGTVTGALRLLDRALRRDPSQKGRAAMLAGEALCHESPEVQALALDLIARHGSPSDSELFNVVSDRAGEVAPSLRARMAAWLGAGAPGASSAAPAPVPEELLERARTLPEDLARLAGVDRALAALQAEDELPPALELDETIISRLDPAAALQAIDCLEQLVHEFASVLENLGPPEAIERVLDGVSRFCAERPDDFERRTAPLLRRASKLAGPAGAPFAGASLRADLCGLAVAWLTGSCGSRTRRSHPSIGDFLSARLFEIAQRAAAKRPKPLLALPTHAGGWIAPGALVERLHVYRHDAGQPDRLDLIQALLRLDLIGREIAREAARGIPGETGAAVRYALGGEESIGPDAALWVVAARARSPHGDDARLEARHPGLGPDCGRAARLNVEVKVQSWTSAGKEYRFSHTVVDRDPAPPESVPYDLPTVLLHLRGDPYNNEMRPEELRWAALVWPANRDSWSAVGLEQLSANLDWAEAEWANRVYLEPLLDPDEPLRATASLLLGAGLSAKEPGESTLATDILIAAVEDGRLDGARLGNLLHLALEAGSGRPGRWSKRLGEAAHVSPLHAMVIQSALERLLQGKAEIRPADLAGLLELFLELCIQNGTTVTDPETREFLTRVRTGKSPPRASALLSLKDAPGCSIRAALIQALKGRLDRAERWRSSLEVLHGPG